MFQLTNEEWNVLKLKISSANTLRLQNETLDKGRGKHTKYLPNAFTEQGLAIKESGLVMILKAEKSFAKKIIQEISLTELRFI